MEELKKKIKPLKEELSRILYDGDSAVLYATRFGGLEREGFEQALEKIRQVRILLDEYGLDENGLGDILAMVSDLRESLNNENWYWDSKNAPERAKEFSDASAKLEDVLESNASDLKASE